MIEIKNLSFWHKNKHVLSNISFNIKKGEYVSLLGKSGCGKTTLVNILAGYLEYDGTSVLIDGKAIDKPNKTRIVVNQENDLFNWLTVWQNLSLVCNDDKKIIYYLNMVDLMHFRDFYPNRLSGGMKKRLSLARALIVEPAFLILDEPFSSLDRRTSQAIQLELGKIQLKTGTTILHITHDIGEAITHSDRVILLGKTPTTVIKEFTIDFKRPRSLAIKTTEKYMRYKKHIAESYI